MAGIAAVAALIWLALPLHSTPYTHLPDYQLEEAFLAAEQEDQIEAVKAEEKMIDLVEEGGEEYHCGWAYLTFQYREAPTINLAILQQMRQSLSRPEGVYFVVLQRSALYLYDGEGQEKCLGVTTIEGFKVDIFPHTLLLDEIFRKESPIRIRSMTGNILGDFSSTIYFYAANASEKEDWFMILRRASGSVLPELQQARLDLDFDGFMGDHGEIYKSLGEDLDGTGKLFSALVARVLFNIHRAAEIDRLIREKFARRTETIPKPFFIGELVLEEVDIGRRAPIISNGRLHSLSHHGELVGSIDIFYPGGLSLKISTAITSPLLIPIVVSVKVNRLAGRLMLKIKPPPSDRLWFGFYRLPDYDISIEPVVSNVALTWGPIQAAILKKVEEAMLEYVVLPNMDDINLLPLISGPLVLGEPPFEQEQPIPPATIQKIIEPSSWTAENLSRRTPTSLSYEELPDEAKHKLDSVLRMRPTSSPTRKKIFVSMNEQALGSLTDLLVQDPIKQHEHDD